MPKYEVQIEWSGYCRGESTYVVEASSEEDAMDIWYNGTETEHFTVRDDTEKEPYKATLVEPTEV